jgi:cyclic pyranopterin phosphate synthase
MMNEDEVVSAVEVAASLGIHKIRLTGGEPLVKRNIVSICRRVAQVEGIREVCLTTNGLLLPELAKPLKEAGVKRLNLSLDTLDPEKYAYITRIGHLEQFEAGLKAALEAGFEKVKINAVLIGGFNDNEIEALANLTMEYPVDMRFIELMPIQDHDEFGESAYVPYSRVLEKLPEAVAIPKDGGVAKLYRLPGAKGNIGLISPVSAHFCGECNRLRLTADGKLKPCLHSADEYSIKGMDKDGMKAVFEQAIRNKPAWHGDLDAVHRSQAGRNMNEIGG